MTAQRAAVLLVDGGLAELHDGAALAQFLDCPLHRHPDSSSEQPGVLLIPTGRDNLSGVLVACRQLQGGRARILFGRQLSDPHLRGAIPIPECAQGIIVGEPYLSARALLNGVSGPPGLVDEHTTPAPRQPLRDLDRLPHADYRELSNEIALAVPIHASRGYPHPLLFRAERAWESPVRRHSVGWVLDQLEQAREQGATQVWFDDQCLNTDSSWLLDLAQGMIERTVGLFWYGRVWADPTLDRAAVHLLRRSGCRGLEVDLFSGSARLNRLLATGAEPAAAARLLRRCCAEGIAGRVALHVGLPGESDRDRVATMAWLSTHGGYLRGLTGLGPCSVRAGAPVADALHLDPQGDPHGWHDGADNNRSQRQTWCRELAQWVEYQGLARPERTASPFGGALGERVLRRLGRSVGRACAEDPQWRRDHLVLAGILHGREAFCGPTTLQLDLPEMPLENALELLDQAASLGTMEVVLSSGGGDPIRYEGLDQVLTRATALGLKAALVTRLEDVVEAEQLWRVGSKVQRLELEPESDLECRAAIRWAKVLAARRQQQLLPFPEVVLRLPLRCGGNEPFMLVEQALLAGVDLVVVDPLGATPDQCRQASEALERLMTLALEPGLFVPRAGWPAGFELETTVDGLECRCPAGRQAQGVLRRNRAVFASIGPEYCRCCPLAAGCPVDRVDHRVRLPLARLDRAAELREELTHPDAGLGQRSRLVGGSPCMVGWDAARVDASGRLFICPECGDAPVGDVGQQLASLWYSRALNEFRHMARTAGRALPLVSRSRCGAVCRRADRNTELLAELEALPPELRQALTGLGAGDRLGG